MVKAKEVKEAVEEKLIVHALVPIHRLISEEEKIALLEKYQIKITELPIILTTDPMSKQLGGKVGDVVEIKRNSETAGESIYYRYVVN